MGVGVGVSVGVRVGVTVGLRVGVGVGVGAEVRVRVGVKVAVEVGLGVAVGTGVVVGDGVFTCLRQPEAVQTKANETAMTLRANVLQLIPLLSHIGEDCQLDKHTQGSPWFDKISYMCYHSVNNLIIWTLLSRGVEGPALRNPGNQSGN